MGRTLTSWGGGGGGGGGKEGRKERPVGGEKLKGKKIVSVPVHVLNSRPPCFLIQYTNALS